jgi:hypothetical protein
MAKISRIGGFTDATARGFVSPADELRARGKLGPYDAGKTEETADVDDADADPETPAAADADMPAAAEPDDAAAADADASAAADSAGEEESWPGSSSETSPEKPPKNDAPRKPSPRKRARSAGGHSGSTKGSGTAPTGTTSGPVTGA